MILFRLLIIFAVFSGRLFFRYVLLKEKNMLRTVEQESKRQCVAMPSPERVKKVTMI